MKKIALYSLLFLLLCINISAQSFHGGVRAGGTASEVSGDNLAGLNKFGFYGSVFTLYPINENTFFKLEVGYIQKGSQARPSTKNQYYDYLFSLQYVEIPVLISRKIEFLGPKFDEPFFNLGLSVAKLVSHKEIENGVSSINDQQDFKPVELNIVAQVEHPILNDLYFTLGFSNSLTPIRSHIDNQKTWKNHGQYHSLWSLGLSYTFF